MGIHKYNRLKAAIKRVQSGVLFDSAEREQARTQFKIVLAEKEWTGTWFSEQVGHNFFDKRVQSRARSGYAERRKSRTKFNISTVSRWMTNKVQPSMEQFYEIALHLDVDVKELLVSSKKYHRK